MIAKAPHLLNIMSKRDKYATLRCILLATLCLLAAAKPDIDAYDEVAAPPGERCYAYAAAFCSCFVSAAAVTAASLAANTGSGTPINSEHFER
jgi:hypothetical protein